MTVRAISSASRWLAGGLIAVVLVTPVGAAEPLTLILLRLLRDQIITAAATSAIEGVIEDQKRSAAMAPPAQPGRAYGMDDAQLRRLIDEGFVHLLPAQRDEVFAGVKRILDDPKNELMAPYIISELAIKASAVRQAHEQMSRLTPAEKRMIAAQAREEYEKMQPEEREGIVRVLRLRIAPIPEDLNEMILAEFSRPLPAEQQPAAVSQNESPVQ